jgi:hypothetical protein
MELGPTSSRIGAVALVLVGACRTSGPPATASVSASSPPAVVATPSAPAPAEQTPAARQFAAWLAAFNSGDRATLLAYHQQAFPYEVGGEYVHTIDEETGVRGDTGGFDVKKSEGATPTTLSVTLEAKHSSQFAQVTMEVDTTQMHRVVHFEIHPIGTPDELLTDDDRKNGAGPVDAARRQFLIDGIAKELLAHYVYPDVGQRMVDALRAHAVHRDYDAITRGEAFAQALTKDLRDVSHDLHLSVDYGPHPPLPPPSPSGPSPERQARFRAMNFGFGAIERLQDNVARVVINGFFPLDDVREAIAGFMTQIADADALIVDLRGNHGGSPETVALVASYLFDAKPVHLNDMYRRDDGSTLQSWTLKDVQGKRFGGRKPIYVLTSHETISGGEELAYDLQSLHRATIIGDITAGAANPASPRGIDGWWAIRVPNGRPINPVTKTNWEGVGVKPDVAVAGDAALDEALRRAGRDLAARKRSGGRK